MALHEARRADLLHRRDLARHAGVGEAFTMLTMAPGPDIESFHDRQIVERDAWADWLDPFVSAKSLIKPLQAGALRVEQVG